LVNRYRQRREEPWTALLQWGHRAGRPIRPGETVIEYGHGLADHILQRQTQTQDVGRLVAREITTLSGQINTLRYGTSASRSSVEGEIRVRWIRVRAYLRQLRLR
jgi:hypothetical protein